MECPSATADRLPSGPAASTTASWCCPPIATSTRRLVETFNDLQGRRDIVPSWCSDHDGIGLVPFGRDQPILERKVRTEVDNCQSLPACRSGEGENPELVARPSGQARQHQWGASTIEYGRRVEGGAQSALYRSGCQVLARDSELTLRPRSAQPRQLGHQPSVDDLLK